MVEREKVWLVARGEETEVGEELSDRGGSTLDEQEWCETGWCSMFTARKLTRMPSSSGVEPRNLTSVRLGTLARNGWRFEGDAEKIFKMMTGMGGLQRRGVVEWRVVWVLRRSNCFAPRVAVL